MRLKNVEIDYGDLIFSKRYELDQEAYEKYFNSCFEDDSEENFGIFNEEIITPLTYNTWYGTEHHKKYITPLLRKLKLEKINKKAGE